jgi:hypothetical protein
MAISTSWMHGNAVRVESLDQTRPDGSPGGKFVVTPFGWGTEITAVEPVSQTWLHIPIPTTQVPVGRYDRLYFLSAMLLGRSNFGRIHDVHLYDGHDRIREFSSLELAGDFSSPNPSPSYLPKRNVFTLDQAHAVRTGISLSFLFIASLPGPVNLTISAAGATFDLRQTLFTRVSNLVTDLVRIRP